MGLLEEKIFLRLELGFPKTCFREKIQKILLKMLLGSKQNQEERSKCIFFAMDKEQMEDFM
jgi:hypothetical protein